MPEITLTDLLAKAPKPKQYKPGAASKTIAALHAAIDAAAEHITAAGPHGRVEIFWHERGADAHVMQRVGKVSVSHKDIAP